MAYTNCYGSCRYIYWEAFMSKADLVALIGSVAIFGLSALFLTIAFHGRRFQRYGREALGCAAAWTFVVAFMRILSLVELVDTNAVRSVNTLSAVVFLLILSQIAWLRRIENNNGKRRNNEN